MNCHACSRTIDKTVRPTVVCLECSKAFDFAARVLEILHGEFLPAMRNSKTTTEAEVRTLEAMRSVARAARSLGLLGEEAKP